MEKWLPVLILLIAVGLVTYLLLHGQSFASSKCIAAVLLQKHLKRIKSILFKFAALCATGGRTAASAEDFIVNKWRLKHTVKPKA